MAGDDDVRTVEAAQLLFQAGVEPPRPAPDGAVELGPVGEAVVDIEEPQRIREQLQGLAEKHILGDHHVESMARPERGQMVGQVLAVPVVHAEGLAGGLANILPIDLGGPEDRRVHALPAEQGRHAPKADQALLDGPVEEVHLVPQPHQLLRQAPDPRAIAPRRRVGRIR